MDKRLLAAARTGSVRARATVINQLQDPWYRMQLALRLDATDAFDRTWESALVALKNLPALLRDDAVEPRALWLGVEAARQPFTRLPVAREAGLAVIAPAMSPKLEKLLGDLRGIFLTLTAAQRAAMVLLVFEGQSSQRLAEAAGASRDTLRRDLATAFRLLRRANPGTDVRRLLSPVVEQYQWEKFPGDLRASLFRRRKVSRSLPIAVVVMMVSVAVILASQGMKNRTQTTTTAPTTTR